MADVDAIGRLENECVHRLLQTRLQSTITADLFATEDATASVLQRALGQELCGGAEPSPAELLQR